MSTGLITFKPDNVKLPRNTRESMQMVTGDVYNIANRIKEKFGPNLFIVVHDNHPKPFVVMEHCADGAERLVKRYEALDARIIEDLEYMLKVPFEKRQKIAELEVAKAEAERDRAFAESEKFDYFATEMKREMKRANMIDPLHETIYPLAPKKVKAGRK